MAVPEEQRFALDGLGAVWERFCAACTEAAQRLDRAKEGFRERVKSMMEGFLQVGALCCCLGAAAAGRGGLA